MATTTTEATVKGANHMGTQLRYEDAAEPLNVVDAAGNVVATAWRTKFTGHIYTGHLAEHHARWHDATDLPCKCGARIGKFDSLCGACRKADRDAEWAKLYAEKAVDWDGKTPLAVYESDQFLWDAESVADYIHDHGEYARLVLCDPNDGIEFDMSDYLCDSLAEGSDIDDREINKTVNDWIKAHAPFLWEATKTPIKLESLKGLLAST